MTLKPRTEHPKVLLSWSGGKDSAYALSVLRESGAFDVVALVTTIDQSTRRVPVHFIREELLDRQCEAVGLPLWKLAIPWPCPNEAYAAAFRDIVGRAIQEGISHMAFGDLFLADIRTYREDLLRSTDLEPIFPLWERATDRLAADMIAGGVKATITCVDRTRVAPSFAGAAFDATLLERLPSGVDPCGENGEFHTFVRDGPEFMRPVPVRVVDIVADDLFTYADVQHDPCEEGGD